MKTWMTAFAVGACLVKMARAGGRRVSIDNS